MKRIASLIIAMLLCLSLLSMHTFAASATFSAVGPQSAEVGQTFQVKLNLASTDVYAISGKFTYDTNLLRLDSSSTNINNATLAVNDSINKFVLYHNLGDVLVNGTGTVVVLNFTVLKAAEGKTVTVKFFELSATDASSEVSNLTATWAVAVPEPEPTPTEPKPTEPAPTEPKPTEPKPTEPKPTEPAPTEPKPTEPKPTEPKPTEPKPTEPKPTEPTPTEPTPTEPAPTESAGTEATQPSPAPVDPGTDTDKDGKSCWLPWILVLLLILLLALIYYKYRKDRKARQNG